MANLKRDNGEPESDADTWEPDLGENQPHYYQQALLWLLRLFYSRAKRFINHHFTHSLPSPFQANPNTHTRPLSFSHPHTHIRTHTLTHTLIFLSPPFSLTHSLTHSLPHVTEPTTGVIDTWAPGSVPVVPVPLEDTARAANSSGGVGVSPSSGRSPAGSPRRGRRRAASINTGITAMVGGGGGGGGGGSGGPAARRRGRSSAMPFPPSELPSHTQQLQMQYLRQQLSSTSSHSLPGSAADRRQHSTDAQEVPGSRRAVTEDKADVASTTSNDNHDSDNGNDVGVDGGGAGTRRDSRQRPKSTGSTASGAGPSRGRAERSISTRSAPKAREAPTQVRQGGVSLCVSVCLCVCVCVSVCLHLTRACSFPKPFGTPTHPCPTNHQGDSHAPRPPPPSLPPPTSASASRGRSLRSLPAAVPFEGNQRSVLPGIGEAHARTDAPLQSEAAQKQQQQQHVVSSR